MRVVGFRPVAPGGRLARAAALLAQERKPNPGLYAEVAARYQAAKRFEEALAVVLEGYVALPDDARLRVLAARLHVKLGEPERAAATYREALRLAPRNTDARRELALLLK